MSSPSVEKEALSDFSEIFQERYDAISKEQIKLQEFFQDVNKWYYKVKEKKKSDDKQEVEIGKKRNGLPVFRKYAI